jgi:hypothetical protein
VTYCDLYFSEWNQLEMAKFNKKRPSSNLLFMLWLEFANMIYMHLRYK